MCFWIGIILLLPGNPSAIVPALFFLVLSRFMSCG